MAVNLVIDQALNLTRQELAWEAEVLPLSHKEKYDALNIICESNQRLLKADNYNELIVSETNKKIKIAILYICDL